MIITVSEFMSEYKSKNDGGFSLGNDFVLALGKDDNVPQYLVLSDSSSEVKASVVSDVALRKYVVNGGSFHRQSAVRKFTVTMYRRSGDPVFQMLCGIPALFSTEHKDIYNYVFFNAVTGIGEKGRVTADVFCDSDCSAGLPAVLSLDLFGCGGAPEPFQTGGISN